MQNRGSADINEIHTNMEDHGSQRVKEQKKTIAQLPVEFQ